MKLLLKTGLLHSKHYMLLLLTFVFMLLMTFSSQMEMLSFGVITKSGSDFFKLFSHDQEQPLDSVSLSDVRERWDEIADSEGKIGKREANLYLVSQKDRNPLNKVLAYFGGYTGWLKNLVVLAGVLIFVALLKGISLFGSQYTKALVMIKVSRDLRQRYFEHIQGLSLDFYHKYDVGSLSVRLWSDAAIMANAVYSVMVAFIQTPIVIISSLAICFYVSTQLSLVLFVGFPVIIFPILYFAKRVKRIARRLQKIGEGSSSMVFDFLSGIHTIKLFAMEPFAVDRFKRENDRIAEQEKKSARYGFMARPILHMVSTGLLAFIILYGLYFAQMSVSEILVFCGLVYVMYEPIKKLNDENLAIQNGIVAAERMYEVLNLSPTIDDHEGATELTEFNDKIEFDNVWFRYEDAWVLKGLSFTAKKGEVIAFVGPTGAGKSTIAQLLPRLYEPEKGEVRIDGKPLQAYTRRSLRQLIAFVPQSPFIFLDTVAQNIAFGSDFPMEKIKEAAVQAHASEFIENLPQKYDTPLLERGKNLSGGQKQRIAIARALVKGSPILVMDEATSSLDAVSEENIKAAIDELRGKVTQILIAHRLSTIEHADRIIFIDHGEVTAQGTKDELMESCPPFRTMWDLMHKESKPPVAVTAG